MSMELFVEDQKLLAGPTLIIGKPSTGKSELARKFYKEAKEQGAQTYYVDYPYRNGCAKTLEDIDKLLTEIRDECNARMALLTNNANTIEDLVEKPQEIILILDDWSEIARTDNYTLYETMMKKIEEIVANGYKTGIYMIFVICGMPRPGINKYILDRLANTILLGNLTGDDGYVLGPLLLDKDLSFCQEAKYSSGVLKCSFGTVEKPLHWINFRKPKLDDKQAINGLKRKDLAYIIELIFGKEPWDWERLNPILYDFERKSEETPIFWHDIANYLLQNVNSDLQQLGAKMLKTIDEAEGK